MNRIQDAFQNKKAFIAFLTAGDPVAEKTKDYIKVMADAGASLIEIGIPFSDPIAEGPTIQNANVRALKNHIHTDNVFDLVTDVRKDVTIPLCFMTYLNVVFHYGYERFFQRCQEAGIDGIIIPDLPYEEAAEVKDVCTKYDVTLISMIAPTSRERVKMIAKDAEGFIYLVSSMGVTGIRSSFADNLKDIIGDIRDVTDVPVAIGFGIHEPAQARAMSAIADGVIVGSAIVNRIADLGDHADEDLKDYVTSMTKAMG